MIKEWATVISWQNGQAVVSCDVKRHAAAAPPVRDAAVAC